MPKSRALIFANPRARRGGQSLRTAIERLGNAGIETIERDVGRSLDHDEFGLNQPKLINVIDSYMLARDFSEKPASTFSHPALGDAIRAAAKDVDMVILGGGDGTLNSAAAALHETKLPFGVLPLGTANDFARTLGIPRDLGRAAQVIIDGHKRPVDLGEVNGHYFFNVASIGFSAALARQLTAEAKKRWGTLGYALAALNLLRQSRPFTIEIDHDGMVEQVRTVQVSVGNGRFYGGGMTVEKDAAPDDGRLDVYSLEIDHWWELLALVPSLRRGTHGHWRKVRAFSATGLVIRTRRPHDINADGEIVGETPATFRIRAKAVTVFAPPKT